MSRRSTLAALAAVTALALTACGGSSDDDAAGSSAGSGSADGAFPVTIPNAFGETTIETAPERIVVIGYTDVDPLLALGVQPVAFQEFVTFPDAAVPALGPWAEDLAGEAEMQVFPVAETPSVEEVLALKPDLVVAVSSGIEQEEYDQLSALVPVLARPEGSTAYLVDRDEATLAIGKAVGQEDEAQELVDGVDQAFADARDANPDFAGKTVVVALPATDGSGGYSAYVEGDTRTQFFTDLGFELTPGIADLDAEGGFFVTVSAEQVQLLDSDLVVVLALESVEETRATLEADPVFGSVPAVQAGRIVYVDPLTGGGAISYNDVLSVPFALDQLVPQIRTALAG
ncbi:iron complex transport system substrate-binding protein [Klenkia marina]|uniref:Iron complex transport system substrate-binding protein n=1 Tax=Klenkia marina TaxID=1960309 RepID=A0A1G4XSI2_9ACTN|nr:iron-siderophore ABC transporter substrate-binding protein [Klenkia marina]SCX44127.1 iron complex transport system substrate-binding protein [Klenkia marina]